MNPVAAIIIVLFVIAIALVFHAVELVIEAEEQQYIEEMRREGWEVILL